MTGCRLTSLCASRVIAVLILVATAVYIGNHRPPSAIPEGAPSQNLSNKEFIAPAVEAIRDKVSLLVTVSLGLAALAGLALKDGWGKKFVQKAINPILLSLFIYFLVRV